MKWNWQRQDWPNFRYNSSELDGIEADFLKRSGRLLGVLSCLLDEDQEALTIDLVSSEALKTSEIEGEFLNPESLQSSVRKQFGLQRNPRGVSAKEEGVSQMMVDLYRSFDKPLTHKRLFGWHRMLMAGQRERGHYRSHKSPMQVVSGRIDHPHVHFEAPPSSRVKKEMDLFLKWFNNSAPSGEKALSPLTRAGMAHLYFVAIHPFDDGNGRLARTISEKVLAMSLGRPTLIALSYAIEKGRSKYYEALRSTNHSNEITDWLLYFSRTVIEAVLETQRKVDFLIEKSKLFQSLKGRLNKRQEKVLFRMFREGPDGFQGGLSAEKYRSIAKTSKATATRDLKSLVSLGALFREGELKHTRYYLNLG